MKIPAFALAVLILAVAIVAPIAPEIEYPTPPRTRDDLVLIDAPFIYQGIDYPNGCESVSTVMALRTLGIEMDVDTFIDEYLDCGYTPIVGGRGGNPNSVYLGDPRSVYGWGCYAPVILRALRKFVPEDEFDVWAYNGWSLDALCRTYVDRGIPVVTWATVGMADASAPEFFAHWTMSDGRPIDYNVCLHCLLLVGYDAEHYYFNDPLVPAAGGRKAVAYPKDATEIAYGILGRQAVVIVPRPESLPAKTAERVRGVLQGAFAERAQKHSAFHICHALFPE